MTRSAASYDLAGPEIPPSADARTNRSRESFAHRCITDPGGPDEPHLTRVIAHYDLRLAELSMPPASHGCSIGPCAAATRLAEATTMFLDCPAYLDQDSALLCGLPAEVSCRFTMLTIRGPMKCAVIRCPAGHNFTGEVESLTLAGRDNDDPDTAGAGSCTGHDSLQRGHNARHGGGGSALRESPAEPERKVRRPNGAPAYYFGRPAAPPPRISPPCARAAASSSSAPAQRCDGRVNNLGSRAPPAWPSIASPRGTPGSARGMGHAARSGWRR
jgi:hypothetical protein